MVCSRGGTTASSATTVTWDEHHEGGTAAFTTDSFLSGRPCPLPSTRPPASAARRSPRSRRWSLCRVARALSLTASATPGASPAASWLTGPEPASGAALPTWLPRKPEMPSSPAFISSPATCKRTKHKPNSYAQNRPSSGILHLRTLLQPCPSDRLECSLIFSSVPPGSQVWSWDCHLKPEYLPSTPRWHSGLWGPTYFSPTLFQPFSSRRTSVFVTDYPQGHSFYQECPHLPSDPESISVSQMICNHSD